MPTTVSIITWARKCEEDAGAGGAERLEGRDRALPFGDVGGDGVRDADAADEQRAEADDGEEAGEDIEEAREVGGRVLRAS